MTNSLYAVIDLKSFYASCEIASRGMDIFTTPLIVSDPERNESSIVMSTSPILKEKYHLPNVCRRREVPKDIPGLIIAQPRMAYYLEMSAKVISILLDYVSEEDLHVYSVDEAFINIGPYLSLSKLSPKDFCLEIMAEIKKETGLVATSGIGPNMFMAKVCLDNEGKKKPPFVAEWTYEDVKTKLWEIHPLSKVWGIGSATEARLAKLGIRNLEQLAKASDELLEKEFGIMGDQLKDLANGIDKSNIREKYIPKETNLSIGQTLMEDYTKEETLLIIREMCDDLCLRLRSTNQKTSLVGLMIGYSAENGGGFARQASLDIPTDDNDVLYNALKEVFFRFVEDDAPIRRLSLSFGKLGEYNYEQLDMFSSPIETLENKKLHKQLDQIAKVHGKDACLRATSLKKKSTIRERHTQIGGHKA